MTWNGSFRCVRLELPLMKGNNTSVFPMYPVWTAGVHIAVDATEKMSLMGSISLPQSMSVLIPNTSAYDLSWQKVSVDNHIKMRSWEWPFIHSDKCPHVLWMWNVSNTSGSNVWTLGIQRVALFWEVVVSLRDSIFLSGWELWTSLEVSEPRLLSVCSLLPDSM